MIAGVTLRRLLGSWSLLTLSFSCLLTVLRWVGFLYHRLLLQSPLLSHGQATGLSPLKMWTEMPLPINCVSQGFCHSDKDMTQVLRGLLVCSRNAFCVLDAGVKICLGKVVLGICLALNVRSSVTFEIHEQDLRHSPGPVAGACVLALSRLSLAFRPGCARPWARNFTDAICTTLCKVLNNRHRLSFQKRKAGPRELGMYLRTERWRCGSKSRYVRWRGPLLKDLLRHHWAPVTHVL